MPAMHKLGFPITSVFDNDFFEPPLIEEEIQQIFEDILDESVFPEQVWIQTEGPFDASLKLDITRDSSGKALDPVQLEYRQKQVEIFFKYLNNGVSPYILCSWAGGAGENKNIITFFEASTKEELAEEVKKMFPRPERKPVINPKQILDILNALDDGHVPDNEGYAKAEIKPGSALEELLTDESVADRFSVVMQNMGLNITIFPDKEEKLQIELPVMYVTRPQAFQARLSKVREELEDLILEENNDANADLDAEEQLSDQASDDSVSSISNFPITCVFDDDFFEQPLSPEDIQETFEEILAEKSFPDEAWNHIEGFDEEDGLMLDITRDNAGQEIEPAQLEFRRMQVQLFLESLDEYTNKSEGNPVYSSFFPFCVWDSEEKNAIVFNGYSSKEELANEIKNLLPRPDKSSVENPIETSKILEELDYGLNYQDKGYPVVDIRPGSTLSTLISIPGAAQRFNDAVQAWGLYIYIDIDQMDVSFPVMYATRFDDFFARAMEMQTGLYKILTKMEQSIDTSATSVQDLGVPVDGQQTEHSSEASDDEDELLDLDKLSEKMADANLMYDEFCQKMAKDKNAMMFAEQWPPMPDKSSIENPHEILNILNAFDEGLDLKDGKSAFVKIKPESTLYQLLSDPETALRFNCAAKQWDLNYFIDTNKMEITLPVLFFGRKDIYVERVAVMKKDLNEMIEVAMQSVNDFAMSARDMGAPVLKSKMLVLTPEELAALKGSPIQLTQMPPQVQQATQVMSVSQYKQYVKENKKFHFFGLDKDDRSVTVLHDEVKTNVKPEPF